jgi:hypothetical protein
MTKAIVLASLPKQDQTTVIAEGLRIARSLEDSVLLLKLAIDEFEEVDSSSQEFRTGLALLRSVTPQIECFAEESRLAWERLDL